VVSITYGGEKEWAWQSAHAQLRSAVADGGGSGSGRGGGATGRRYRRLQRRVVRRVVMRWQAGVQFRAWREWAARRTGRRTLLRRVGGRLAHHYTGRAFGQWVDATVGVGWREVLNFD